MMDCRHLLLLIQAWCFLSSMGVAQTSDVSYAPESIKCWIGASEGVRRYRAGAWSVVEVFAENPTDVTVEAEAVLRFVDDPTLQFGRRVTIPRRSVLRTTCPVLVPHRIHPDERNIDVLTTQTIPSKPTGTGRRSAHDTILAAQTMSLNSERPAVGMIIDVDMLPPLDTFVPVYEWGPDPIPPGNPPTMNMALAAQQSAGMGARIGVFDALDLPADLACLDVLDILVLASDRLAGDPAGIAAVRNWVLGGGQLWVALNDVQHDTVAAVLGDAYATTVVDRIQLDVVQIRNATPQPRYAEAEPVVLEKPVDFVRVIAEGVTVTDEVNGWPAAFWQPYGLGRVFFTTVGAAAWMRPRSQFDEWEVNKEFPAYPRQPLRHFADELFLPQLAPRPDLNSFQSVLSEQIGYRILSRQAVFLILAGFCVLFSGVSAWLLRINRAERLLWMMPIGILVTSLIFLVVATISKRSVPPTFATATRIVLEPGVATGHLFGLAALYNPDGSNGRLGATNGSVFFPDMTAMTGRDRRMIWTDEGRWYWDQLELPPGVRTAPLAQCLPLQHAASARARFDKEGLRGNLGPLPISGTTFLDLEDAIVVLPYQPVMTVEFDEQGSFHAGPDDVLACRVFVSGTVLDDDQRRRGAIYDHLFGSIPPDTEISPRPLLCVWTDKPSNAEYVVPQEKRLGATLITIPLLMERPPAGAEIAIPAPFLPYRAVSDPEGRQPSVYNNFLRVWQETNAPATEWIRFQLPETALPLRLDAATLSIHVRAPSRTLEVLARVADETVVVSKFTHPIGLIRSKIHHPEQLQLDAQGGLLLAIRAAVGDDVDEGTEEYRKMPWKIESSQLEVNGTVLGE